MKKKLVLIGGGGHCRSVIDVIEQEGKFEIVGVVDNSELVGTDVLNYKVIGSDEDLAVLAQQYKYAIITVGQIKSSSTRRRLFELAKQTGFILPVIISSRAYVSKSSYIDEGTVVMHDALINANVQVGKNCIVNTKALIEHDCVIEDDCHISTGAIINGGVYVKKQSFVGSQAVTREAIVIQEKSFLKAGSLAK